MSTSNHTSEIPYGYCHCGCGQKTSITPKNYAPLGWVKGEPKQFIRGHYANIQAKPLVDRFWAKVAISTDINECWEWRGVKVRGYGRIRHNNKPRSAHRTAYELTYGEIPDGLFVCHKCDNPACCNPNHLFLGTNRDNTDDKVKKGRQLKGEKSPTHKLNQEQVNEIRMLYATGQMKGRDLGKKFGVSFVQIYRIISGESWRVT